MVLCKCNAEYDCGSEELVAPDNGTVCHTHTTYQAVAVFACEEGFQLKGGAGVRRCEVTGWTHSNPTCGMKKTLKSTQ